jgi:hypothetical protein
MDSAHDNRTLQRFVAGLPVGNDELAEAVAARAVGRAIVIDALLSGLADAEPAARRSTAERIGRMAMIVPEVAARLRVNAVADRDADVRTASAAALRKHGQDVPGDGPPAPERPGLRQLVASLRFRALRSRPRLRPDHLTPRGVETYSSASQGAPDSEHVADLVLVPSLRDAPDAVGSLFLDHPQRLEFKRLPDRFAGTRPTLRAFGGAGGHVPLAIKAEHPVTIEGSAVFLLPSTIGPPEEIRGRLAEIELVVLDD